jgi:hypothetical protein
MDNDVFTLTAEVEMVAPVFIESSETPVVSEPLEDSFTQTPAADELPQADEQAIDWSGNTYVQAMGGIDEAIAVYGSVSEVVYLNAMAQAAQAHDWTLATQLTIDHAQDTGIWG